jgi:hypothetical protein
MRVPPSITDKTTSGITSSGLLRAIGNRMVRKEVNKYLTHFLGLESIAKSFNYHLSDIPQVTIIYPLSTCNGHLYLGIRIQAASIHYSVSQN